MTVSQDRARNTPVGPALGTSAVSSTPRAPSRDPHADLVAEWNNPDGAPSVIVFSIGLALGAAAPAALAHALLAHGDGRIRGVAARVAVTGGYIGAIVLLGAGPAVLSDPRVEGCPSCPADLLHLATEPGLAADLWRWGLATLVVSLPLAGVIALVRAARASAARRRLVAPVMLPGCLALGLAAGDAAHAWSRGFVSNDPGNATASALVEPSELGRPCASPEPGGRLSLNPPMGG